jgi:hypothetical protein
MSLTYSSWVNSIATLASIPTGDTNFQTMLPNAIDDAELRLYRDLDLLNTVVRDSSSAFTTSTRTFNLPSSIGTFVVTDQLNVITPAGTSNPESGTRNPLTPSSKEMLDAMWPSSSGSTVPTYFAMVSQSTVIVGPWPDQAYQVEVVGTIRPQALSSTNTTTLLSVYFPDLFVAASMVFTAGYMKNFGAAVDDPKSGVTWEQHYGQLLASAKMEEQRKKFASEAWSDKTPAAAGAPRA